MIKVKYLGTNGARISYHDNPKGILEVGKLYELRNMEVYAWYTYFYLVGIQGRFNSVLFEGAKEERETLPDKIRQELLESELTEIFLDSLELGEIEPRIVCV